MYRKGKIPPVLVSRDDSIPPPLPLSLLPPLSPLSSPHPYWTHTAPNIFLVILAGFVKNYNARFVCNSPFKYLISICSNQKEEITNLSLWLADFLWNRSDSYYELISFNKWCTLKFSSTILINNSTSPLTSLVQLNWENRGDGEQTFLMKLFN